MRLIAIDGACRRNGKADCTASGGVVIKHINTDPTMLELVSVYEYGSTNQRGEMLALLKALDYTCQVADKSTYILTDSEYIYNAMTKHWYETWNANSWLTSGGSDVKNKDIWLQVMQLMRRCDTLSIEPIFYHIKGHCISFGRVTADNLLARDPTGALLYNAMLTKYDSCKATKATVFKAAQELSERNNGYKLDEEVFKDFVVMNTLADAVATKVVDAADSRRM